MKYRKIQMQPQPHIYIETTGFNLSEIQTQIIENEFIEYLNSPTESTHKNVNLLRKYYDRIGCDGENSFIFYFDHSVESLDIKEQKRLIKATQNFYDESSVSLDFFTIVCVHMGDQHPLAEILIRKALPERYIDAMRGLGYQLSISDVKKKFKGTLSKSKLEEIYLKKMSDTSMH